MAEHYIITGKHTGHQYLVVRDYAGRNNLVKRWTTGWFGGPAYYPPEAIRLPRDPNRADRKARRIIAGWERSAYREWKRRQKHDRKFNAVRIARGGDQ